MNFLSVKKDRIIFLVAIFMVMMLGYSHEANAQNNKFNVVSADTIDTKPVVVEPHSPHKATFYSAILPGLGQAYNRKYWKIPILYAGIGGVIYGLDFNTTNYKKYRRAYRDYLIQDPGNTSYLNENVRPRGTTLEEFETLLETNSSYADWFESALENKRDYYKRYRDLSYVGLALVYVLNLVDASVDAHFKTFDVSNDLSMHIEPTATPMYGGFNSIGMQIRFTF
ncbi:MULTISPECIES: DUF5683 domain-containing protein [unclassified Saccharicrinis]|uniref:DUF5683 domain-containing protein n=1 Tax=unclassified Saccharicrinis TaxID=2646859 RepID=UPI003D3255CC